jgi:hypothetical protein
MQSTSWVVWVMITMQHWIMWSEGSMAQFVSKGGMAQLLLLVPTATLFLRVIPGVHCTRSGELSQI